MIDAEAQLLWFERNYTSDERQMLDAMSCSEDVLFMLIEQIYEIDLTQFPFFWFETNGNYYIDVDKWLYGCDVS